ncbi:MAG: response regulator [Chloroflexi bacterium]|nr:response regulator [Chloroflexota bacterium]
MARGLQPSFTRTEASIRILIAEDDPNVRSLVQNVIKDLGHATSCARNGAEALELYDARGADVVVSDWMMPRMDGVDLCRCVRARQDASYTYFILLTSLDDAEHRLAGMQAGVDDYVAKPFNVADIEARLIAAERVTVVHRRGEALLRLARGSAAETDPERLLENLLREAIGLVGGSAGIVTRWDDDHQALAAVGACRPTLERRQLRLCEGASGRAARRRAPVVRHRSPDRALNPVPVEAELESALAVPLLHDSRLVGTLAIGSSSAAKVFSKEDAELLKMLASTAAATLVALEHARLDGVRLAARTAEHELNNQLAVARGYAELLVGSPDMPRHLRPMAEEVMNAADDAASIVRQMRTICHIREIEWNEPGESTINLIRSQK